MDDRTALLRAVIAAPDDDLPRLVFADWLEEHDEGGYAAFIRAQIELANTPPWEPFAVRCRHFAADTIVRGTPWQTHLPQLRPGLEWHAETAFRRGFPWSLIVREMPVFMIEAERLFEEAPIGQLHLPTATLDQWRWFGEQAWLPRVKSIHFYGLTLPIEPVSVLCDSPNASGLEEVVFEVSRGVAMPMLVERLFRSPLGRQLRSMAFRGIDQAQDELIAGFSAGHVPPRLTRLAFGICRFESAHVEQLAESPVLDTLTDLEFESTALGASHLGTLVSSSRLAGLSLVTLASAFLDHPPLIELAESPYLQNLRMLDLQGNWMIGQLSPRAWAGLLRRLRSLDLSSTHLGNSAIRSLVNEWTNLTELDVSRNKLTTLGMRRLIGAPLPPELTVLDVRDNPFHRSMKDKLRRHFGDHVIL